MTPFVITLQPGANVMLAATRAARVIIDRWMPHNAGGVHWLVGGQLAGHLAVLWGRANARQRPIRIRVHVEANRPVLTELVDHQVEAAQPV